MRELREENGNSFSKLGLRKVIHVTHMYHGVCLTCLMVEHYVRIACNVKFHHFMFIFH